MLRTLILGGERPVVTPYTNTWVIHVSFSPSLPLSISSCSASTRPCMLPYVCSDLLLTWPQELELVPH